MKMALNVVFTLMVLVWMFLMAAFAFGCGGHSHENDDLFDVPAEAGKAEQ